MKIDFLEDDVFYRKIKIYESLLLFERYGFIGFIRELLELRKLKF